MTFMNPLGFLALLAIPFLVAIYIIKSKYTEQVIPSTYLWTLSERFLKRRNPVSKITGIISLILQIFAVILISLAVAHPVFAMRGKAMDYCFVLDCSGSMNIQAGGSTRFEKGKGEIEGIISSAATGSSYTLISAGDTTDVIFLAIEDKEAALNALHSLDCSCTADDLSGALKKAQELKREKEGLAFYLITDKDVQSTENVKLITVGTDTGNCGLSDVEYEFIYDESNSPAGVKVTGSVTAYGSDMNATVQVFVNGGSTPAASAPLEIEEGGQTKFTLQWEDDDFTSLKVALSGKDALSLDDEVYLYNMRHDERYKTLIVSETPFFVSSALRSFDNVQWEAVRPADYDPASHVGYGLYVFESFTPSALPRDGAVWFINPVGTVENSGFNFRGSEELSTPQTLKFNNSSSSKVAELVKNCDKTEQIYIKQYVKCGLQRNFTSILTCDGNPVVFTGSNSFGNREVVLAFDVHWSDFALAYSYVPLMNNLLSYTFPSLVDEGGKFVCGKTMDVKVLPGCSSLRVDAPDGTSQYLKITSETGDYIPSSVGEHTVTAVIGNRVERVKFYAQLPEEERTVHSSLSSFSLSGEEGAKKRDGRYEDILYLFIVLAVIVVADWAVYCYEQYQLR